VSGKETDACHVDQQLRALRRNFFTPPGWQVKKYDQT
jgi:hypothetical protein